jgi:hypothetical protein
MRYNKYGAFFKRGIWIGRSTYPYAVQALELPEDQTATRTDVKRPGQHPRRQRAKYISAMQGIVKARRWYSLGG